MNCTGSIHEGIYNCYGEIDISLCLDCKHNSESESENKKNNFVRMVDRVQALYDYLRGIKRPEGTYCRMPKLSNRLAIDVIWFLQEVMHCLPDNIEQCKRCKGLFDAHSENYCLDDQYELDGRTLPKKYWGHWCNCCVSGVDFGLK